ncbi:hypothetical protein JL720_14066 [Aureococcus anophagefferens]|nr:hypothetical protein JL720_14066 [Aureococcus anophagefferens]
MGKPPWLPVVAALSLATTTARNSLCADYCAAANSDAEAARSAARRTSSIHNAYERSSGRAIGDGSTRPRTSPGLKPTVTLSPSPQAADPPAEMTEGPVDAAPGTAPNSTQTSPQNSPVGRVPQESPSVRARVKTWEANNPKKQIITFGRPPSSRSPSPSLEPRTVAKPPPRVRDDVSVASGLDAATTDDDAEWTTVRIRNRKTGEATAVRVKKGTDVRELVDRYASSKNKAGRVRVTNATKKPPLSDAPPSLSSKVWKEEAPPLPPAPVRRPGFLALAVIGLAAGGRGPGFGIRASSPSGAATRPPSRARRGLDAAPPPKLRHAAAPDAAAVRDGAAAEAAENEARWEAAFADLEASRARALQRRSALIARHRAESYRDAVAVAAGAVGVVATGAATALLPPLLRRAARLAALFLRRARARRRRRPRGAAALAALPPKYAAVAAAPRAVLPPRAVPPPGPSCRPGRPGAAPGGGSPAAPPPPLRPNSAARRAALIHAPLAFLNGLFAGGEEKRRPGAASRLAGIAVAAAFILAPDDGRTW